MDFFRTARKRISALLGGLRALWRDRPIESPEDVAHRDVSLRDAEKIAAEYRRILSFLRSREVRHQPTVAQAEAELLTRELKAILRSSFDSEREAVSGSLWGLALSGGGIRSATFSLGVLQSLAKNEWLGGFHYLSTVSGGGYIGAYLQGLICRKQRAFADACEELGNPNGTIRELRCFSNFLAPDKASFSADKATFVSTYVSNLFLTQAQLLAWLMLFLTLPLLLYIAFVSLGNALVVTFALASALTVGAMSWRSWIQLKSEKRETFKPSSLASVVAPLMLLGAVFAVTALLLGGVCHAESCQWPGSVSAKLRFGAAIAVYALGFLTWLAWWPCIHQARRIRLQSRNNLAGATPSKKPSEKPSKKNHKKFSEEILDRNERAGRHIAGLLVGVTTFAAIILGFFYSPSLASWAGIVDAMGASKSAIWAMFASDVPSWLWMTDAFRSATYSWWSLIFGFPLVFSAIFLVSALQAGIAFNSADGRLSRERWSRMMGTCGVYLIMVSGITALVSIGPWAVAKTSELISLPGDGWLLPVLSIASSAAGARIAYFDGQRNEERGWLVRSAVSVLVAVAPVALVLGALLLTAMLAQMMLQLPSGSGASLSQHLAALHMELIPPNLPALFGGLIGILTIGFLLSYLLDENECSMNGFYRNRLVRCYLAPSADRRRGDAETDQDPVADDIRLSHLLSDGGTTRPLYPLVCAAANLTATADLDWQDRRAASYLFSPLFCGHLPPVKRLWAKVMGDRPLANDVEAMLPSSMTLGTAIATSGAAVSPNMGYHSSPPVAFLLTLFNARLGWWVENLNATDKFWGRIVGSKLLSELVSRTRDSARYTYVSDGGHFENLGIYELVRRKCRFIVCVDASADPDRDFDSLGNAIHKCRVDFGAKIDIDVSLMRPGDSGISRRGAVLGKIDYGTCEGLLLYIKPSITGGETADIARYASAHPEFPHQPTHDQFFDEHQFEAYRQLGNAMGDRLFGLGGDRWELVRAGRNDEADKPLDLTASSYKETLLQRLEHWLFEPSDAKSLRFATHGAALRRLQELQRGDPRLSSLDVQLNTGWIKAGGDGSNAGFPDKEHFRPCFYFIQEVIQLMEAVYLDLDLERNFNHPDNRGWMNLFRQWTWVPMFRLVWALTSQSLGSRFVHFCEALLGAPPIKRALELRWHTTDDVQALAENLHRHNLISTIEKEILESPHVVESCKNAARMDVGRLLIDWSSVLEGSTMSGDLQALDVGLVVAVSDEAATKDHQAPLRRIIIGRVQDHVRRMGFGAQMIYLALQDERQSIDEAEVAETNYGMTLGRLETAMAKRQRDELRGMLRRARQRRGLPPSAACDRSHAAYFDL
jgi:hypothetical protein